MKIECNCGTVVLKWTLQPYCITQLRCPKCKEMLFYIQNAFKAMQDSDTVQADGTASDVIRIDLPSKRNVTITMPIDLTQDELEHLVLEMESFTKESLRNLLDGSHG